MILNHLTFVDAVTQPTYTIKPRIRGIINLGNTCFLNSLIQSLHSTSFPEFVLEYCKKNNEDGKLPEDYNLSLSVNELFECISNITNISFSNLSLSIFNLHKSTSFRYCSFYKNLSIKTLQFDANNTTSIILI